MRFFIVTDLEGVVGVDSFSQTRTTDNEMKGPGMKQLGREVNACIEGIKSVYPNADIAVWDGHGTGGMFVDDLVGGHYVRGGRPYYDIQGYSAMLFVGQHAMAGTPFAPLCHTFSSTRVAYYRLNGSFIGEFGALTTVAASQNVPTILLSGDDKAAFEARMWVPSIETAVVKWGTGLESATHRDPKEACDDIRTAAARAVGRLNNFPMPLRPTPPYSLEIRYLQPGQTGRWEGSDVTVIDDRTVQIQSDNLARFQF